MSTVIGNLRVVLGLDAAAFQRGMTDATAGLKKMGENMQRVGRQMSLRVTAPVVAFGGLSIRTAANFETAMNRVRAVSGATGEELDALTAQARELGAATQFSASDAADAMGFLAMAGYETNQILAAMPDTLRLASAAQLDMADAADIVTNILAGYSMEVDDLAHANDVLVKAFTSANTDLRQLGEAMKYAGPVASAAGVEFEEAAAALAMMGNAGIQAGMAGTSLRGAIARMLSPTKAMQTAMQEAGLSFTDAQGRILPLADILEQLEPHAEDAGLMMELFGQRAGPAMAALVSQGSESVRELTQELRDSAGAAEAVSKVQMEGFNGAIKELQSAFEELQIGIASSGLMETVGRMVLWLTDMINAINKLSPEMLKWATIIATVAAAIGPLLVALGATLKAVGLATAGFAAIANPVGLAVAAIAALTAGIIAFWPEITSAAAAVRDFAVAVYEGLSNLYQVGVEAIANLARGLREGVVGLIEEAKGWGADIASGIRNGISNAASSVTGAVRGLGARIKGAFTDEMDIQSPSKVFEGYGRNIGEGLAQGIEASAPRAIDTMKQAADGVINVLEGALLRGESLGKGLRSLASSMLGNWASKLFQTGMSGLFGSLGIPGFASGGYTGNWSGPGLDGQGGRMALLHPREHIVPAGQVAPVSAQQIAVHVTASFDETGNLYVKRVARQEAAQMGAQIHQSLPQQVAAIRRDPRARRG